MAWNLKDEKEQAQYIENLGMEYRFGCYHEKKPEVCHLLGDYFEAIKQDWDKAAKIFQVNCESFKYGHSCLKFGNYLYMGKGSLKKSHKKAVEYYEMGCSYKHPESCLHAGLVQSSGDESQVAKDHKKAHDSFSLGCQLSNAMSCFYLSGLYLTGVDEIIQKDMTKAFEFSLKACELGNIYACANLSQMYLKGDGVAKNEKKAEEYKKLAVEMQDQLVKQFRSIKFEEGG